MKKLILAALVFGVSGHAMATDWWVYNGDTRQCVLASAEAQHRHFPAMATPYDYRKALRQIPQHYEGMQVHHFGRALVVLFQLNSGVIIYGSTHTACSFASLIMLRSNHDTQNLNELK